MDDMTSDQLRIVANTDFMKDGVAPIRAVLAALGMPVLTGSGKQIDWAENVRAQAVHMAVREMLAGAPKGQKNAYANQAAKMVAEQSADAKWWIDHRNEADTMLRLMKARAAK